MEYSLQYYPDSGIAFDITKMLFVKLTPEQIWKPMLTSFEKPLQDFSFIQKRSELFPSPKPELFLFANIFQPKQMMFLSQLLIKTINAGFSAFSITKFLAYFDDIFQVKKDLFSFYSLENIEDSGIEHSIRSSDLFSDKLKVYLFGFYLSPQYYVNELKKTILAYYEIIHKKLLVSDPISLVSQEFIDWLFPHYTIQSSTTANLNINFSLCFTTPEFLLNDLTASSPFFITTLNTIENINFETSPTPISILVQVLSTLGDKRRIEIINLLITHHSMSIKEIASALQLSDTAVHHHIAELKKADLITTSYQNRKAFYSFKPETVSPVSVVISKLAKGEPLQ